jgi:hypothetical protein
MKGCQLEAVASLSISEQFIEEGNTKNLALGLQFSIF